jgi:hypothetical protein
MFSTNFTVDYYKKMIGIDCVIDLYLSKVYLSINDIYQNMMSACNLKGQCNLYNNDIPSIRLAMSKVVPVPPGPKFFFDRDQNFFCLPGPGQDPDQNFFFGPGPKMTGPAHVYTRHCFSWNKPDYTINK